MGDRTLGDIVKQALTECRPLQWVAQACYEHGHGHVLPRGMDRDCALRKLKLQRASIERDIALLESTD